MANALARIREDLMEKDSIIKKHEKTIEGTNRSLLEAHMKIKEYEAHIAELQSKIDANTRAIEYLTSRCAAATEEANTIRESNALKLKNEHEAAYRHAVMCAQAQCELQVEAVEARVRYLSTEYLQCLLGCVGGFMRRKDPSIMMLNSCVDLLFRCPRGYADTVLVLGGRHLQNGSV